MSRTQAAEHADPRLQTVPLATLAVSAYVLLFCFALRQVLKFNFGHFTYALDDPYIHLALSQSIAHGHYGINLEEASSPSSSALWPLLLAPFARFRWQMYVPLAFNAAASLATAILIGAAVARWPQPASEDTAPALETVRRAISVLALLFVGNLLGLTFLGMEHTLQVLLAGAGAWAIIACLRGLPVPLWCLAAVALGPLVRYENLGISLAVAMALVGYRQMRRAIALLVASIGPLLLFSVYLHRLGLPWLPTSVLVKSHELAAPGLRSQGLTLIGENFSRIFAEPQYTLVAILFLTLAGVAWNERLRERRFALWGACLATGLQLLIGRFGWFHRYEVYAVFFSVLVLLHVVHERPRGLLGWYALGLLGCSFLYLQAFNDVPLSSNEVFRQQYQMHRFIDDFYNGNVAVNDLGLVSYNRPPGTYVLDLWGLGSVASAQQRNKSTAWLQATVRAHNVGLVMIYKPWFAPAPKDWTLLGDLCLKEQPIALGSPCVTFYATPQASLPELQDELDDFVPTLPPGVTMQRPALPVPANTPPHP
ncbi:MAG: hypothetical protein ACRYFU_16570 [Janthinobacterium lividum]